MLTTKLIAKKFRHEQHGRIADNQSVNLQNISVKE